MIHYFCVRTIRKIILMVKLQLHYLGKQLLAGLVLKLMMMTHIQYFQAQIFCLSINKKKSVNHL